MLSIVYLLVALANNYQREDQHKAVVIDSTDDIIGLFALVIAFILVVGVFVACNNDNNDNSTVDQLNEL